MNPYFSYWVAAFTIFTPCVCLPCRNAKSKQSVIKGCSMHSVFAHLLRKIFCGKRCTMACFAVLSFFSLHAHLHRNKVENEGRIFILYPFFCFTWDVFMLNHVQSPCSLDTHTHITKRSGEGLPDFLICLSQPTLSFLQRRIKIQKKERLHHVMYFFLAFKKRFFSRKKKKPIYLIRMTANILLLLVCRV